MIKKYAEKKLPSKKVEKPTTFQTWYAKHKDEFAAQRRLRYQGDAEYREAAKAAAQAYRDAHRVESSPNPEGYDYTFKETADKLGVSIWALREWRKKNYFPEPMEYKGGFWFTAFQLSLVQKLKTFFDMRGIRISAAKRADLDELISLIYGDWQA